MNYMSISGKRKERKWKAKNDRVTIEQMENTNHVSIFFLDEIFYFVEYNDIDSALLCSVGAECKKQGSAPRSHLVRSWLCSGGAEQSAKKIIRSTEQICSALLRGVAELLCSAGNTAVYALWKCNADESLMHHMHYRWEPESWARGKMSTER
jgi:hypothetical protein